jgi:chromosome segregation ATPase
MPQQPSPNPLFTTLSETSTPEVEAALQHFWEVVRRTADEMVTLRQVNTRLNDEVQRLNVELTQLSEQLETARSMQISVVSREREQELLDKLAVAATEFERHRDEALGFRAEAELVKAERDALQREIETLRESVEALRSAEATSPADGPQIVKVEPTQTFQSADTHEMLMARITDLEQTLARYRSAGLAYIENPIHEGQMSLFAPIPPNMAEQGALNQHGTSSRESLRAEDLRAIAARLDSVAERIGGLFGIS